MNPFTLKTSRHVLETVKRYRILANRLFINFYPRAHKTLRWIYFHGFEINRLSLCVRNPGTVPLISWCSFGGKTGIFASCVIYCGTHLHIKALISPSEHERGNSVIIGRAVAGDESVFGSGGRPRAGVPGCSCWPCGACLSTLCFFSPFPCRRADEEVVLLSFSAFSSLFEVSHTICLHVILMALLFPISAVRGATNSFTGSRASRCFFILVFIWREKGRGAKNCG